MILLDTHVWLWWVNGDTRALKSAWKRKIDGADRVAIAAISCFEVAWLERHRRIELPCARTAWFEMALAGSGIDVLPMTPAIASCAVDLAEHHQDPQDRIIIATAVVHACELMSSDKKFASYDELAGLLLK